MSSSKGLLDRLKDLVRHPSEEDRSFWLDDIKCKACYECDTPFHLLLRRHHCRMCGRIFCSNCSSNYIYPDGFRADQGPARVCNYCFRFHRQQQQGATPSCSPTPATREGRERLASPMARPKSAGVPAEPSAAVKILMSRAASQQQLAKAPLEGPASRIGSFRLLDRARQAGLAVSNSARHFDSRQSRKAEGSSAKGKVKKDGALVWAVPPELENFNESGQAVAGKGRETMEQPPLNFVVGAHREAFAAVANKHLAAVVAQLLAAEGIQDVATWCPLITQMGQQAAQALSPSAMAAHGVSDPRHYIKVKKVPGVGQPGDSCLVDGLVCRRKLAHKRMPSRVVQPRIMMLASTLEYHRTQHKLSSFDTLLQQEHEHLRLAVERIMIMQPDVLLVEKSVARFAQEMLLGKGVALILNVKPSLLERLARCTGAQVASSVENLNHNRIAFCKEFLVETLQPSLQADHSLGNGALAPGSPSAATGTKRLTRATSSSSSIASSVVTSGGVGCKTLVYFKGCPRPLGCTVLLKGAGVEQLRALKRVMQFAAYAAYHGRTEVAFLADEVASAAAASAGVDLARTSSTMSGDGEPAPAAPQDVVDPDPKPAASQGHSVAELQSEAAYEPVQQKLRLQGMNPEIGHMLLEARGSNSALAPMSAFSSFSTASWNGQDFGVSEVSELAAAAASDAQHVAEESASATARSRPQSAILSVSPHVSVGSPSPGVLHSQPSVGSSQWPYGMTLGPADHADGEHEAQKLDAQEDGDHQSGTVLEHQGSQTLRRVHRSLRSALDRIAHAAPGQQHAPEKQPASGNALKSAAALQSDAVGNPQPGSKLQRRLPDAPDLVSDADDEPMSERQAFTAALQSMPSRLDSGERDQASELYDRQRLYVSMACRNPHKGLMCEPPAVQRIDFYQGIDVPLATFLAATGPNFEAPKRCAHPGCGDGITSHLRTFLHHLGRITLSVTRLPRDRELPGADRGQVWLWTRPLRVGQEPAATVRRVPLSSEASCMSVGHFLSLSFGSDHLRVQGRAVHGGHVRYFGMGGTVLCFHHEAVRPSSVQLPSPHLALDLEFEQKWLLSEVTELAQEASAAFDAVDAALYEHAYTAHRMASQGQATLPELWEVADPSVISLLTAAADERSAFEEMVYDVTSLLNQKKCMLSLEAAQWWHQPHSEAGAQAALAGAQGGSPASPAAAEAVARGVAGTLWEITRLRRSLAVIVLTWAATLHDPSIHVRDEGYARSISASAMSRHGSMASLVDAAGPPAGGAPQGLTEHTALTERTWSAPGHIDVALQQQQQLEPRSSGLGAVGATGAGSMTVAVASTASSVGHSPEGSRAQSTSGSIHNLQGATSEVAASNESSAPQPSLPSQPNRQPSTAHTGAPPGSTEPTTSGVLGRSASISTAGTVPAAGQVSRLAAQWEKRQEGTAGPANSRSLSHAAAMHRYAASALENRARTLQWLAAARPGGQGPRRLPSRVASRLQPIQLEVEVNEAAGSVRCTLQPTSPRFRALQALGSAIPQLAQQAAEQNSTGPGQKPGQQVAQQEPQLQEAAHWAAQQDTQPQPPKGNQSGPRQGTEPLGARQAELQQQQAPQPGPQLEQRQGEDSCRSSNETTGTVPAQGESAGSLCLSAETGRETSGHPPAEAGSGVQLTESSAAASEGPAPVIPAGNTQACQEQALGEEEDLLKGAAQPAGQAGQPVDAEEHFDRLQHDTSTASNLLSHFDDWEAIVQQAGHAGGGGGREAVNPSSGATVVNADVIREAVQDFLQRQVPASSAQTMMNGSALAASPGISNEHISKIMLSSSGSQRRTDLQPGCIPLSFGKVELTGRALLPPGVDDTIVPVFDDEPTSLVAYSLTTRSYQKFLKDAEAFVLYGAPKPGAPLARNMHTARSTHDLASLAGDSVPSTWADEPLHSQRGRSLAAHGHSLSRGSESSLQAAAAHLSRPGSPRTPAQLRRSGSSLEPKPPGQPAAQLTAPVPLPQGHSPARLSRLASTEIGAASPTRPPTSKAGAGQVRGGAAEPPEVPAQPKSAQPGSFQPGASLHTSAGQVLPPAHQVPASLSPFAVAASQPAGDHADQDQGPTRYAGVADHPLSEPGSFKPDADLHSPPHLAGGGMEAGDAGFQNMGRPQSGRPAQARVTGEAVVASPAPSLLRPVAGHLPPKHPPPAGDATGDSPSKPAAAAATHDAVGAEWQLLLCPEQLDFRHTLEDEAPGMPWARAKFQTTAYYAPQFAQLRRHCVVGGEAAFLASMARCRKWSSRGGKSSAFFAKTRDDRYVVKQLLKSEKQSFLEFAPVYFRYLADCWRKGHDTSLAKVLGVFQVTIKHFHAHQSGLPLAKDGTMDVLIIENIFYGQDVPRIYDLKGSERSRWSEEDPSVAGSVLMDANLRESNLTAPLLVEQMAHARLQAALWRDTAFLASLGVMDYSLLVGVDRKNHVLVAGIIDFVRQYTWDKQLETWVKSSVILGGGAGKEPTVISPKQYCRRFRAAMTSYFICVPSSEAAPSPLHPDAMM